MQRGRSALDSFPEPFDLNQGGSHPENTSLSWAAMLNSVETRMPNDMSAASHGTGTQTDVACDFAQRFSGWDRGESSSRTNTLPNHDTSGMGHGWPSFHAFSGSDSRIRDWSPEPNNISSSRNVGSHGSLLLESHNSNSRNAFLRGYDSHGSRFKSTHSDSGNTSSFFSGSGDLGGSSGLYTTYSDSFDCHFSAWGSSRKTNTSGSSSGQLYPSGRSNQNMEKNLMQDWTPVGSGNFSSSSLNPRVEVRFGSLAPDFLPSSRAAESSNPRVAYHNSISAQPVSRSTAASQFSTSRSVNQSLFMHSAASDGMHSGCTSALLSGESWSAALEGGRVGGSRGANPAYGVTADHIDWSFTPGNSSSRNSFSGGSISRARNSAAWPSHPVQTSQNHHRLSEAAPWNNHVGVESGVRRSLHYNLSSAEGAGLSRSQLHSDQTSVSPPSSLDLGRDDWPAPYSSSNRRHSLIQHFLSTMNRGASLRTEDLMLIDPLLSELAELHDSHRDMRLDVDNMSYEELLALEERIGNVSTGLSEHTIEKSMKRRRQEAGRASHSLEPCCICQEEYGNGDDIGVLDCGHEFHTECIRQWLVLKNICPICKMTALRI